MRSSSGLLTGINSQSVGGLPKGSEIAIYYYRLLGERSTGRN
jgi:hypothetical protein